MNYQNELSEPKEKSITSSNRINSGMFQIVIKIKQVWIGHLMKTNILLQFVRMKKTNI